MKIVGTSSDLPTPEIPRHGKVEGSNASGQPVNPVQETDSLHLSGAHKVSPPAEGDIRAEKVAEIKAAIESNTFMIDFTKVADQMINEAASLIETMSGINEIADKDEGKPQNSQEKFGAGPANLRTSGPDR